MLLTPVPPPRLPTPRWATQVDAFLGAAAGTAPTVFLQAATWKLGVLSAAHKAARSQAQRAGGGSLAFPASAPSLAVAGAPAGMDGGAGSPLVEQLAVAVWSTAADMLQRGMLAPEGGGEEGSRLEAATACQRALQQLGLPASAAHVGATAGCGKQGHEEGRAKKENKRAGIAQPGAGGSGGCTAAPEAAAGAASADLRFQMRHCGHLLPREAPRDCDPRVESFNPDIWQRQVCARVCACVRACACVCVYECVGSGGAGRQRGMGPSAPPAAWPLNTARTHPCLPARLLCVCSGAGCHRRPLLGAHRGPHLQRQDLHQRLLHQQRGAEGGRPRGARRVCGA